MGFYKKCARWKGYEWMRWTRDPPPLTRKGADKFLVSVLLDRMQDSDFVEIKAAHLVRNHFRTADDWWVAVAAATPSEVETVCRTGYHGKHYAEGIPSGTFHDNLKSMARRIIEVHRGDPRNIWRKAERPDEIYKELVQFDGIAENLGKMGTFMLVREHGAAGGIRSRSDVCAKLDEHVRRVTHRTGIAPSTKESVVEKAIADLHLRSPADFDAAAWVIGKRFCHPARPDCTDCPLHRSCKRVGL